MCGELHDWISDKQGVLGNDDLGKDKHAVQALQRKHQVGRGVVGRGGWVGGWVVGCSGGHLGWCGKLVVMWVVLKQIYSAHSVSDVILY